MQQIAALADEDVRRMMRAMSADIQASLALSRATLHAVAMLSHAANEAAEEAIEQQIEAAQRLGSPDRMITVLKEARLCLTGGTEAELSAMDQLERALLAAAEHLPDIDAEPAEAPRASARR